MGRTKRFPVPTILFLSLATRTESDSVRMSLTKAVRLSTQSGSHGNNIVVLINFAHPLTPEQLTGIEALAGQAVERVIEMATQFDPARPYAEQTRSLMESAGLTAREWQSLPLLVNLPSFNVIAALLLAEIHGRCGY